MTTLERINMKALNFIHDVGICIAVGIGLALLFGLGL